MGRDIDHFLSTLPDETDKKRRRTHLLRRRVYISDGPNLTCHMDGFDEL